MKRPYFLLPVYILVLILFLTLPIDADTYIYEGTDGNDLDSVWGSFLEGLPDEIRDEIGGLTPEDTESWQKYLKISYWTDKLGEMFRSSLHQALTSLTAVLGILLLIAGIRQWSEGSAGNMFQFCSDLCMALTISHTAVPIFQLIRQFLEQLCHVMTGMLPVMTVVSYSAGEVTTASVNRIAMTLFITVLNELQRWLFLPLGQALFSLSILTAICTQIQLGGFVGGVKKLIMTLLTFMLLIYSFVYGIQNTLAKSTDSLGLRAVKFAMGSFIPVVGSTVADAFSAVREGLGYVRVMTGLGGILILLLMILPVA
ncbi:MAG: hypothetical protein IJX14_01135, partial [Clostridia bacterium]|nr:hypothetical protein [Clostridia bacterium]